jgi:hypothetical protein
MVTTPPFGEEWLFMVLDSTNGNQELSDVLGIGMFCFVEFERSSNPKLFS